MFNIFYEDSDLVIILDWADNTPILHHHVYDWSLSVHKKMKREFERLITTLKEHNIFELYSYYNVEDTKLDKFCSYYGFRVVEIKNNVKYVVKEL